MRIRSRFRLDRRKETCSLEFSSMEGSTMGPGDILKIGLIVIPLVMFIAYFANKSMDDFGGAVDNMVTATDETAEKAEGTWN